MVEETENSICCKEDGNCSAKGGVLIDYGCPLHHFAHRACIKAWLVNSTACPYCRQEIKCEINTIEQFFEYYRRIRDMDRNLINTLNSFSPELQIECIKKDVFLLEYLIAKIPELCRLAVENNGFALQFVPDHMKTPEFVSDLVRDGYAMNYIPENLKTYDFCLSLTKINSEYVKYLPKKYRN